MAQPAMTNMSLNGVNPSDTKEQNNAPSETNEKSGQAPQPTVRHIPIFVEGRDEPLINKNVEHSTTDSANRPQPPINDMPLPGSIYSRVKDLPVKKNVPEFCASPNLARTSSPSRTIPINVVHSQTQKDNQKPATPPNHHQGAPHFPSQQQPQQQHHHHPQQKQHQPQQAPQPEQKTQQPSAAVQQSIDAITKIQKIQHEVLELMNRVEKFKGGSRKDREYVYLDEMLTQNLLKLDTIDAEGKDNIKAARKEAINCINKCIAVLEAKTDSSKQPSQQQTSEDTSNEVTSQSTDANSKTDDNINEKSS